MFTIYLKKIVTLFHGLKDHEALLFCLAERSHQFDISVLPLITETFLNRNTVTYFCLSASVSTFHFYSVCCENKCSMVCTDLLVPRTQFKALVIDLHASHLPKDTLGSFT